MSQPAHSKNRRVVRRLDPRSPFIYQAPIILTTHENPSQDESSQDSSPGLENCGFEKYSSNEDSVQGTVGHQEAEPSYQQPASPQQLQQSHTAPAASCHRGVPKALARDYVMQQSQQPQRSKPAHPFWPQWQPTVTGAGWPKYSRGGYSGSNVMIPSNSMSNQRWNEISSGNAAPLPHRVASPQNTNLNPQCPVTFLNDEQVFQMIMDVDDAIKRIDEELKDLGRKITMIVHI